MKRLGFTLIEMVVTILIVSVMFLGIAGFVKIGAEGYADTTRRQALHNQARFVVEKISREIRHAVPNSLVVNSGNQCLSFYPIRFSGFYQTDDAVSSGDNTVNFIVGNSDFDLAAAISAGARIVINPSRVEDLDGTTNASRVISSVTVSGAAPNAIYSISASFPSDSIANRHYIYIPSERVEYCLDTSSGSITRDSGVEVQVGQSVVSGAFTVDGMSLQRGGLVHLNILFESEDEQSNYNHDVQVLNVP
ncbi:putative MSHA biogenesis protein MshO [Vibrio nigripulchritudo SO65]|uniref:PilW family protein n=1 Tax=Vibrio nigripulchritudo TaxID=28173 RepID=UPI0003B1B400|nr:prepilin-type N-terminal cleavage/methylation domain-containing protein [Vibrio nigripulchritudo]CCN37943.1 putative MSHA biogenesis protein MshO [Vibrio nigripulchritudo AM115]CCN38961.1 putative MSHA biogenesis protein MshO [Vibrio nigripulchritudo FTn2]CCN64057.1 putative MSHA biogenesis protein MshO [Vibrio nigripulchritudo POn4]CCN76428.1 putative MSHA biogenesis protein MshO [Vibrio nigripulchritudo SO65]